MRNFVILIAAVLVAAGMAFGYTYSHPVLYGMWVYDGLVTYDHGGLPVTPNALHFNVGAGYLMASEYFDEDGNAEDLGGDISVIGVPIDVGYAFNENLLVDLTLQILSTSITPDAGDSVSAAGLGDVWVKGRYIAPVDSFNLGGRLGVKIPVGAVDYTSEDPPLGDDQMDIDVAAVGSLYPDEGFAFNGQIGFRYRMPADIELIPGFPTVEVTPGTMIYLDLAPGYTMGADNFQVYVPIGYFMTTDWKVDGETAENSAENGLFVGVAPKYGIDANNMLGLKFLYPIMGTNTLNPILIGFTYEGYVPM
jgi:hypothetical protein